jgi:LytS/YehU family sensor histidine kinase
MQDNWNQIVSPSIRIQIEKKPYWWQQVWIQLLLLITLFVLILIWVERVRKSRTERRVRRLEEKNTMLQLKKVSVTKLLTTHYLFNALTTIRSLALKENKEEVYQYITRFSKLIRALVDRALEAEIVLEDELEWILDYVSLETRSLDTSIEIRIKSEVELDAYKIPAFVLQPIIENALRYGDYSEVSEILVEILDQPVKLVFRISNPVSPKTVQQTENKTSKGLELTKERLITWSLMYHTQSDFNFSLNDNQWEVSFTIPKVSA